MANTEAAGSRGRADRDQAKSDQAKSDQASEQGKTPSVGGAGQILQLMRDGAASTTSELAAALGLSRSTITQRLESLVGHGLIVDDVAASGVRGRPAAAFRFNHEAGIVLAAHVGMTGSRFAATDLEGEVLAERFITTDIPAGPERLLQDLTGAFEELIAATGREENAVVGLGVGIPSSVELSTYSRSSGAGSTPWDRLYFKEALWQRFKAPVFLDLDVNLLALAERRKAWPDAEVFICVKLGTLINASIVVNGRAIHGISDLAGELGHMRVSGSIVPCGCGNVGCLDAVASGSALVKQLANTGFEVKHVSEVVRLAARGVPDAEVAVRDAGRHIGEVLASVVNLLNPDVICAWGYLADAQTQLFAGIREGIYQHSLPASSGHLQLVAASLGDLAGVKGAAMMVIDQVLEPAAVDRMIGAPSKAPVWPPVVVRQAMAL